MTTPDDAIQAARADLSRASVSLATAALVGEGYSPRIMAAMNALLTALEALEAK